MKLRTFGKIFFSYTLASGIDVGQGINVGPTSIPEARVYQSGENVFPGYTVTKFEHILLPKIP